MIPIRFFGNLKTIPRSLYLPLRIPSAQKVLVIMKALSAKDAPGWSMNVHGDGFSWLFLWGPEGTAWS